ncbi:MAG: nicotinamide-nucleotide amidohydrolase family protein [Bacteroidales bacterium]|nr:nicotinamide-nucleotide amidohydrolase family protein [Bacteroidales bacterium]
MTKASICTIGDEILIGQIVDTNSSRISRALGDRGIQTVRMVSLPDDRQQIISLLSKELTDSDIVVCTGGLGPTKDDITKDALAELSGSRGYVKSEEQEVIIREFLHARGLDVLPANLQQAMVPDSCKVILNRRGTAPVMAFHFPAERFGHPAALYSLPGVPFEAEAALPDVLEDICAHFPTTDICHRTLMTYGLAESALSALIAPWEDALPSDMHLAYLPNPTTGVRLRLSIYGGKAAEQEKRIEEQIELLKPYLGDNLYALSDTTLEAVIGDLLRGSGKTLSTAESCTGGMIAHLLTTISGSSEYFLGSVVSYAPSVKCKVLGVNPATIESKGIVSSDVAAAMAEGVRRVTGSTYSVATTGWADTYGDEREPAGTVWVGVSGPSGTVTKRFCYHNDRKRNIERFAASALDLLRRYIERDCRSGRQ